MLALAALAGVSFSRVDAPPAPSWRCIAGICLGQSRSTIDRRYGHRPRDLPSREVRVPGGYVEVCFWRCTDAVTEDGFTYYGGRLHPADRVLTVGTCSRIVRLPDGTEIGTAVPRKGRRWNGYRHLWLEGGLHGWERAVGRRPRRTVVTLTLFAEVGRVRCVDLGQAP